MRWSTPRSASISAPAEPTRTGLLFALICGFINYFLLPAEIEKMYQLDGLPSPISASLGFWVLLPIAGPLIWLAKVQDTANAFWLARGAIG